MPYPVRLTSEDRTVLLRSVYGEGGFQNLQRDIKELWDRAGRGLTLTIPDLAMVERIHRYAFDYGNGGWQDRLRGWCRQLPAREVIPEQGTLL